MPENRTRKIPIYGDLKIQNVTNVHLVSAMGKVSSATLGPLFSLEPEITTAEMPGNAQKQGPPGGTVIGRRRKSADCTHGPETPPSGNYREPHYPLPNHSPGLPPAMTSNPQFRKTPFLLQVRPESQETNETGAPRKNIARNPPPSLSDTPNFIRGLHGEYLVSWGQKSDLKIVAAFGMEELTQIEDD
jgi:hypothetical protein